MLQATHSAGSWANDLVQNPALQSSSCGLDPEDTAGPEGAWDWGVNWGVDCPDDCLGVDAAVLDRGEKNDWRLLQLPAADAHGLILPASTLVLAPTPPDMGVPTVFCRCTRTTNVLAICGAGGRTGRLCFASCWKHPEKKKFFAGTKIKADFMLI